MDDPFLDRIRRTISAHRLIAPRARVIVAVSGGADSVALLEALHRLGPRWSLTLHLAHLDHALRDDSARDAAFVRSLGMSRRIATTVERRDVQAICARNGWSLEEGARRVRYQFLQELAVRQSASRIALAHTADDQAETVLMRVVRGTGLLGLSAIPIQRSLDESRNGGDDVRVVRPLLEVWRCDVMEYLRRQRLSHQEDATNRDLRFLRNRIRHELLPLLEQYYNPNIRQALTQLAQQSHADYAYLQEAAGRQWKRLTRRRPPHEVAILVEAFLRQPPALRRQLIRHTIQRVQGGMGRVEFRHWLEVERLFLNRPAGTLVRVPGGAQFRRERDQVVCRLIATTAPSRPTALAELEHS